MNLRRSYPSLSFRDVISSLMPGGKEKSKECIEIIKHLHWRLAQNLHHFKIFFFIGIHTVGLYLLNSQSSGNTSYKVCLCVLYTCASSLDYIMVHSVLGYRTKFLYFIQILWLSVQKMKAWMKASGVTIISCDTVELSSRIFISE